VPPASISSTEKRPDADRRSASTEPAEPAPTMMKSKLGIDNVRAPARGMFERPR
jgi:hypothetical protein